MYLENLYNNNDAVVAGDTEFQTNLILPNNFSSLQELKKVICQSDFVLTQLAKPQSEVVTYEHPSLGAGWLPTWKGNCALSDYLGFNEVDNPNKKKVKEYKIAYLFYYSSYDIFGLFRNKDTQLKLAKELLGGRVLREKSFPNHLKTGVFIEVPTVDNQGNDVLEIREISIKLYDARGYTPAGVSGLAKTFETWGVKFTNKNWLKYFDISRFKEEYLNTVDMVEVPQEDGSSKWMSKHDIVVAYATGDGLKEMFELYEAVHNNAKNTLNKLGYPEYTLKNLGTIGNIANQVGVARCLNTLDLGYTKESMVKLAQYLYPSSAYSLLDGCFYTVNQVLNLDGGFCKNMKPTEPIIHDLVLDMDLAGAYAESMRSLPYAVGIPNVMSFPKDRAIRPNFLKEFSKLERKRMIYPGAWVARVTLSEKLTFKQDLIFSKHFGKTDFEKSISEDDDGFQVSDMDSTDALAHIPDGAFQLLNNEVTSGILTHDILQFVNTYWSKSECKEFFSKLNIDCLMFYNAKYLLSPEEFKVEFEKLDDTLTFNFEGGTTIKDKRKPIWCIVPTDDGWFGDLTNIRNTLKSYSAIAGKLASPKCLSDEELTTLESKLNKFLTVDNLGESDRASLEFMLDAITNKRDDKVVNITKLNELASQYKCEQNGFKCVNNSSYGVTGSGYWMTEKPITYTDKSGKTTTYGTPKIGNMVFAQNITARVRLGAYCLCKGTNGFIVVTDGAPAGINQYWSWEWKGANGSNFGSQQLWNLSRYSKPSDVDPKGLYGVKLMPVGGGDRWEVTELEQKSKLVTISNGQTTFTGKEESWGELDNLVYAHVKALFGELDIFKSDVLKYASKDLYKGAAFQSQANYLFEKFFTPQPEDKDYKYNLDVMGQPTNLKIKARGYNLSKKVCLMPDMSDDGFKHPYEGMMSDIYYDDAADVYIPSVYSPQLLGVDDFNKSENVTNDFISRGFLPHSPTFRSSKPSPFSLSMFKWNTREQYEMWSKKVESWKRKTGFGVELLFLTEDIVSGREKLVYSQVINKIQEMIDCETSLYKLNNTMQSKVELLQHPQKHIMDNLACEVLYLDDAC